MELYYNKPGATPPPNSKEDIWGETSAEDCKKYVIFWDIDGSTGLF